ncbi:MAG: hypothetical protein A4E57_00948 [Syntrophorhabdaceae bacterium PtaU1.Bin034]|nr:MAG: hypothetical protein A4E57_00948 [Syntrophorhabdaceae bacterium PtaU1.Bin034]
MEKKGHDKVFLIRDGQSRKGRFPDALRPYFAKVDDRGLADFLDFAKTYAGELNYFNGENSVDGDWTPFFSSPPEEVLSRLKGHGDIPPHLALYLAFLLLLRHPGKELNKITDRHLDFYYRKVLGLREKAASPDFVHLLFELKKGVRDLLLEKGTAFKAGKDKKGKDLIYVLAGDTIVNRAGIAGLRAVRVDPASGTVFIAPKADSSDGVGGPLDKQSPQWDAFGTQSTTPAEIGFALASPVLLLSEGTRKIDVTLTLSGINAAAVRGTSFEVLLTGPKGWIGPKETSLSPVAGSSGLHTMSLTLSAEEAAVVAYSPKIHGGDFATALPVMQLLIKKENNGRIYKVLREALLTKIKIDVEVKGMTGLTLESDTGSLDPSKPFMPFGINPDAGTTFYVGCNEAFRKEPEEFSFEVLWKVPQDNLADYYQDYTVILAGKTNAEKIVPSNDYFKADLVAPYAVSPISVSLFAAKAGDPVTITSGRAISAAGKGKARSGKKWMLEKQHNLWAKKELERMEMTGKGLIITEKERRNAGEEEEGSSGSSKKGFAELRLTRGFLQREYRDIYTRNIVTYAATGEGDLVLPKEPYTPVMKSIRLNYTATTDDVDITRADEESFLSRGVEFFHITAFGQMREDAYLRERASAAAGGPIRLLPQYRNEGEFYIGVLDIEPLQNLSLLFQLVEGSADPASDKADIKWSILGDNYWRPFTSDEILADGTNSLLKSGIMRFAIPGEASGTNTILPVGMIWLRAAVEKNTDAVCKFAGVLTNAGTALFADRGNDPAHLSSALPPKSITGPVAQIDTIKGVEQPFASFGGAMAENRKGFYTRVSERLRHKNRAVTIWDCERMVLDRFPSIYKVKCIGHTSPDSLIAPGHMTVVVIPDMRNRDSAHVLEPRVDKATLGEIADFVADRTGLFATIHVENPVYEKIKVDFKVAFYRDYEFGHYRDLLNREIIEFLTPWAFDRGTEIVFGGQVHKSVILDFVEDRPYVDYVTLFRMYQDGTGREDKEVIRATGPRSILVSASTHTIELEKA